ncbi:hypothetical protein [Adhaeribacter radiodurans]|nr:hypothetical protein [Adhaeribacter radiodurans]
MMKIVRPLAGWNLSVYPLYIGLSVRPARGLPDSRHERGRSRQ